MNENELLGALAKSLLRLGATESWIDSARLLSAFDAIGRDGGNAWSRSTVGGTTAGTGPLSGQLALACNPLSRRPRHDAGTVPYAQRFARLENPVSIEVWTEHLVGVGPQRRVDHSVSTTVGCPR